jgi:hypothetical protein
MHRKMIPVLSSGFAGYLHLSDGTLLVTFKRGAVYAYDGVPKDVVDGMLSASSKGAYLNANIVKGNYRHREVTNEELDKLLAKEAPSAERGKNQTRRNPAKLRKLSARHPVLRLAF